MKTKSKRRTAHRPERDRAIFEVLRAIRDRKSSEVAGKTYVAASTIANWRSGRTRYPQHHTLAAVAKVAGLEYRLVPIQRRRSESDEQRAWAGDGP